MLASTMGEVQPQNSDQSGNQAQGNEEAAGGDQEEGQE